MATSRVKNGVPVSTLRQNDYEVCWTASTIVLAALLFESYLGWSQRYTTKGIGRERNALSYYNSVRESDRKGASALPDVTEVFVVRDSLVHNHVWEVEYDYSEGGTMTSARPLDGFGDSKWKQAVDTATGKTKPSAINAIPSRMDRADARKILQLIVRAMEALIGIDALLSQALTDVIPWPMDSNRITLKQIVEKIEA